MRVILAEAAIDENGQTGYEGTRAGDQNGNEVRNIDYYEYRKGWVHVYRWKDKHLAERFAIRMQGAVDNNNVGYSQPKRYTYWDQLKASSYDPLKIKNPCEVDCSALVCANVNAALLEAGIKTRISPMEYTASMEKAFSSDANFIDVISQVNTKTGDGLQVGDILLGPPQTHTAACVKVINTEPSKTPQFVAEATEYCNVWADTTKSKNAVVPALGTGNLVDVCDEVGAFYYVRIIDIYGYVEKKYLKPHNTVRTMHTVTALNLRTKPPEVVNGKTVYGNIILSIPEGATVAVSGETIAGNGAKWYKATYHGAIGYCSAQYVK